MSDDSARKRKKYLEPGVSMALPKTTKIRLSDVGERLTLDDESVSYADQEPIEIVSDNVRMDDHLLEQTHHELDLGLHAAEELGDENYDHLDNSRSETGSECDLFTFEDTGNSDDSENSDDLFTFEDTGNSDDYDDSENSEDDAQISVFTDYDVPLLPNVTTTQAETILMVLTFAVRHGLTWVCVEDLLHLINTLCGTEILPETKYTLRRILDRGKTSELIFHFYCKDCFCYLRQVNGSLKTGVTMKCPECNYDNDLGTLKHANFYVMLPLEHQLKDLLKDEKLSEDLLRNLEYIRNAPTHPDYISDITDGTLYKSQRRKVHAKWYDITVTCNTDGSPVFKSSKCSIWPIQLVINELSPAKRWANVLVAGLWFGKGHPNMNLFIETFVQEFSLLAHKTFVWKCKERTFVSSLYCVCWCVDSPARSQLLNCLQFNGYYGCSWCLHPGTLVGTSSVKYTVGPEVVERTSAEMLTDMAQALATGRTVHGVKGPTPLINMAGFDIVWGCTPDYMHCICLGAARQITELMLTSVDSPFHIDPDTLRIVDQRLCGMKPPQIITRLPRSLLERKFWKASEWKMWLLFYAIPCLEGLILDRYFKHLELLVEAVFLLLQEKIQRKEVNEAELLLTEFVYKTEELYGKDAMTFNIHQLLHVAKSAKLLGPLWSHSAFVFEGGNGKLLKLVTAAKGVPLQIMERYQMERMIYNMVASSHPMSEKVSKFYREIQPNPDVKVCKTIAGITLLGKAKMCMPLTASDEQAFQTVPIVSLEEVLSFPRMIYRNHVYHSQEYTRCEKSDNSVIMLTGNRFAKIKKIVLYTAANIKKCGVLCQKLILLERDSGPSHILRCDFPPSTNVCLFDIEDIVSVCVFLKHRQQMYVCKIPNTHERD